LFSLSFCSASTDDDFTARFEAIVTVTQLDGAVGKPARK